MVQDLRAARQYLAARGDVTPGRIAIPARRLARRSAAQAAAEDRVGRQPRALVAVARLPRPAPRCRRSASSAPGPLLLVASDDDGYAVRSVRELQKAGGGVREAAILSRAGHGTAMLPSDPDLAGGWWNGSDERCYDRTLLSQGLSKCPETQSFSASPACSSACSSAGSSAASRAPARDPLRRRQRRRPPRRRPRQADGEAARRGARRVALAGGRRAIRATSRRGSSSATSTSTPNASPTPRSWYEQALAIEPRNVNASTDLGIGYYYMNQPDRALAQFDRSLAIDPRHTKTLLNVGIVRAYAKEDLEGAAQAWQRVVEIRAGLAGRKASRSRRSRACEAPIPMSAPRALAASRPGPEQESRHGPAAAAAPADSRRRSRRLAAGERRARRRRLCPRRWHRASVGRQARTRSGLRHLRLADEGARLAHRRRRRFISVPTSAGANGSGGDAPSRLARCRNDQSSSSARTSSRSAAASTPAAIPPRTTATSASASTRRGC